MYRERRIKKKVARETVVRRRNDDRNLYFYYLSPYSNSEEQELSRSELYRDAQICLLRKVPIFFVAQFFSRPMIPLIFDLEKVLRGRVAFHNLTPSRCKARYHIRSRILRSASFVETSHFCLFLFIDTFPADSRKRESSRRLREGKKESFPPDVPFSFLFLSDMANISSSAETER